MSEDQLEFLGDDAAGKICIRALWQSKRGWAESVGGSGLPGVNLQFEEMIRTLNTAKQTELALKNRGISVSLGTVGQLLEVLPALEKASSDSRALQKAHESADRRLAATLFERFLAGLLEAVESDAAKAKVALSNVRSLLQDLDQAKTRIMEASRRESVRFADLDSAALEKLVDQLVEDCVRALSPDASIENIAVKLGDLVKDLAAIEEALVRLEDAFGDIKKLVLEEPQWMHSHSGV